MSQLWARTRDSLGEGNGTLNQGAYPLYDEFLGVARRPRRGEFTAKPATCRPFRDVASYPSP